MSEPYANRKAAGQQLAALLREMRLDRDSTIVLALPRGGVPVAAEIAWALHVPLDVFLVRKLGYPGHEEFAMGAIASGGVQVLNPAVFAAGRATEAQVARAAEREWAELKRRVHAFRGDKPFPDLRGKTVILVDDGLATGSTMRAAIAAVRQQQPARIVVAVPVGAAETCQTIAGEVDLLICPLQPELFQAVGRWYHDFDQTSDEEVQQLLAYHDSASPEEVHHAT
jgi:predicted phosphoribosyltransferase